MTAGHTITIAPADLHVTVTIDGETVAETDRPVLLDETGLPTRYYLRPEDVSVELRPTSFSTHCPFKGDASYWNVSASGNATRDVMWAYRSPFDEMLRIKDHGAFYPNKVRIEATPRGGETADI